MLYLIYQFLFIHFLFSCPFCFFILLYFPLSLFRGNETKPQVPATITGLGSTRHYTFTELSKLTQKQSRQEDSPAIYVTPRPSQRKRNPEVPVTYIRSRYKHHDLFTQLSKLKQYLLKEKKNAHKKFNCMTPRPSHTSVSQTVKSQLETRRQDVHGLTPSPS